jgi:hypothetical protein
MVHIEFSIPVFMRFPVFKCYKCLGCRVVKHSNPVVNKSTAHTFELPIEW